MEVQNNFLGSLSIASGAEREFRCDDPEMTTTTSPATTTIPEPFGFGKQTYSRTILYHLYFLYIFGYNNIILFELFLPVWLLD